MRLREWTGRRSGIRVKKKTFKIKPIVGALRNTAVFLLILHLLFFSAFALYHVYAANELEDSHGCVIGEWVHLGQQTAVVVLFLIVYLLGFDYHKSLVSQLQNYLLGDHHPKRGPPIFFFSLQ